MGKCMDKTLRIGIISALNSENGLLVEKMDPPVTRFEKGERQYLQGCLWGIDTVVAISGMGKVAASITATQLIASYSPDHIIFTGVAGGIQKNLRVGDVVVADGLIQHDMDSSPLFPRYEIPFLGIQEIIPDQQLSQKLKEAATKFLREKLFENFSQKTLNDFGIDSPQVIEGLIASGDQFLSSQEERMSLARRLPKVCCVEMEGAAIAQVCHEYHIPFAILRTISDTANEEAMIDFEQFVSRVAGYYSLNILQEFYQLHESLQCLSRGALDDQLSFS